MSPCLLPPRKFFIHCHTFATFQIDFFKTQSEFDLHSWCLVCDCVCSPAVKRVRQSDWDVGRQSFFKWQPVVCMTWTLAGRMKLKAHSSSWLKGEKTDQMTCFFLESKTNRGFICDSCGFSQGFESMLLCLICKSVIRRLLFITFSASLSTLQMDFLNHFSDYTFVLTAVLKQCGFISSAVRLCVVSLWKRNKKNWCEIWTDLPVSPASLSDWGCEWLKVSAVMHLLLRFLRSSSYTLSRDRDVNDSGAGRYGSKLNSWMWDFLSFFYFPHSIFFFLPLFPCWLFCHESHAKRSFPYWLTEKDIQIAALTAYSSSFHAASGEQAGMLVYAFDAADAGIPRASRDIIRGKTHSRYLWSSVFTSDVNGNRVCWWKMDIQWVSLHK